MITLFFLFVLVYYIYMRNKENTGLYPIFSIVVPIVIFILFVIEVSFSSLDFFVSDEIDYIKNEKSEFNQLDRIFWFALNQFLLNVDIFGNISLKLISIPILFFTLYMLWSIFYMDKRIFLLVIVLPYISFIATKNLRDIFILFFTVSSFFCFYKLKPRWIVIFPISLLFLIRPFIGFLIISLILYDTYIRKVLTNYLNVSIKKGKFIVNLRLFKYVIIVFVITFLLLQIPYFNKRLGSYWYYLTYYTVGDGYEIRLNSSGLKSTGLKFLDYSYGALRYVLTPIPTSIFGRLLKGGSSDWGIIDDFIRVLNQVFHYLLLIYVSLNIKNILKKLRICSAEIRLLTITLLMYLPIYTFYGFGAGHQRIKIPFQIAIFLMIIINKNLKLTK